MEEGGGLAVVDASAEAGAIEWGGGQALAMQVLVRLRLAHDTRDKSDHGVDVKGSV